MIVVPNKSPRLGLRFLRKEFLIAKGFLQEITEKRRLKGKESLFPPLPPVRWWFLPVCTSQESNLTANLREWTRTKPWTLVTEKVYPGNNGGKQRRREMRSDGCDGSVRTQSASSLFASISVH